MSTDHLRIMCPALSCRRILAVPTDSRGKNVRCKNCGATIRIPEKQVAPVEPKKESPAAANAPAAAKAA
jgi:hypothetical protein